MPIESLTQNLFRHTRRLLCVGVLCVFSTTSWLTAQPAHPGGNQTATLALVGGTLIDLTHWGHSANDLHDAVILIRDGRISEIGTRLTLPVPKGSRVIECNGKFLIPGLVDGYAGLRNQAQANAFLYMGVTTVVAASDEHRGFVDRNANPSPHLYMMDSIGTTDNWSLLANRGGHSGLHTTRGAASNVDWSALLHESGHPEELTPEDTARQLQETARLGTRVLWLGPNLTAANTQWIIAHAHQMGLITYGQFVATPYKVGIEAGVDALPEMGRYEMGVIPAELQKPLVQDPWGTAATTAFEYAEHLPPTDLHLRNYATFLAAHRAAIMPELSLYYLRLPDHRNLWHEPAAQLLDAASLNQPPDRQTGEQHYPVTGWMRKLPASQQRWVEDSQRHKADQSAMALWLNNQTIFSAFPHYLAASGAPVSGTMPGISLHTELELLVRLGLSPREALASATSNYAAQFGWTELGLIAPGRRADVLVLDSDPTHSIWNARRITTLIVEGNVLDREALLNVRR